ncbi:MAG: MFS transporter [Verrucomicrobiales bacterium]|nr:MFS transporter [Verrucomicrobiales bacterium]
MPSPTAPSEPAAPTDPAAQKFGRTFWILNTVEMGERLAYYNLRVMAPIYIMQADNPGGLHLTAGDKGTIYAWWAAFQSLLPIVTGGFADRFGYKRTLAFSLVLMMAGYVMIALLRDVSFIGNYWGFFSGILVLATGTAFFKPSLQGSLAQNLTKANSSMGWGIFYWIVNVGALVGHYLPSAMLAFSMFLPGPLHGAANSVEAWRNLFLASALFTSLNLLLLPTFQDVPSGASKHESILQVLGKTITNILDARLIAWLLIMSGFWMMMYQLWDLQPNFIADWVDSRPMAERLSWLPEPLHRTLVETTARGPQIPQQVLLSANALFIILGVLPAAWLTRRMRTLEAMLIGMLTATAGVLVAGLTTSAWVLVLGILFFSIGEMTTGPKKNEYLGLIAPPGKKGLYLGYVNIPVGVGVYIGSKIAGFVYGHFGEKAVLALRYLAEKTDLGRDKGWNGDISQLETVLGVKRTEAMARLSEVTGMDAFTATQTLWDTYHPQLYVWIPFAAVGVVSALALWIFGRMARRWSDMNA